MGRQVHVVVLQGLLEVERHAVAGGALNLYHVVRVIVLETRRIGRFTNGSMSLLQTVESMRLDSKRDHHQVSY